MINILRKQFMCTIKYTRNSIMSRFTKLQQFEKLLKEQTHIRTANSILYGIGNNNYLNERNFTDIWKKYVYYVQKVYDQNKEGDIGQLNKLFKNLIKIYEFKGKFKSQNLLKILNKLSQALLAYYQKSNYTKYLQIISLISVYNQNKGEHLFLKNTQQIYASIKYFNVQQSKIVLKIMTKTHIFLPELIQLCVDIIYKNIFKLTNEDILKILQYLSLTKKYINRSFIIQIGKRILEIYDQFFLKQKIDLFNYLTIIQKNSKLVTYIFELDQFYQKCIHQISLKLHQLNLYDLKNFVQGLRKSSYYSLQIAKKLIRIHLQRDVKELENSVEGQHISIQNLLALFHLLAVYNHNNKNFFEYFQKILILADKGNYLQNKKTLNRILWSACILEAPQNCQKIISIIIKLIYKDGNEITEYDIRNIYYCFLYLKLTNPNIITNQFRKKIEEGVQNFQNQMHISLFHKQVQKQILKLGIPCLVQYSVNNISCDICIPDLSSFYGGGSIKNVIIDMHGYQHFFRNCNRLKGNNKLKQKLLKISGYEYFYIPIDEWQMSDNKQEYLKNFLDEIIKYLSNK